MRLTLLFVCSLALAACPSTPAKPTGHVRLFEAPSVTDVAPLVAQRVAASQSQHRDLLVYVGATWCEPCKRFHDAAASGQLDVELGDVDLLVFDADRDAEPLAVAGYVSTYIPLLVAPGPDGRASERRSEGSVKGDGAIENMLPRVRALLRR